MLPRIPLPRTGLAEYRNPKVETLLKARNTMLIYRAASVWTIDYLFVASPSEFGGFVFGASAKPEIHEFVDAKFS